MSRLTLLVAPLLLLVLAACSPPEITPELPSLAISPNSVEAQIGGPAVPFTATLQGVEGDVTWALVPEVGTLSTLTGSETAYTAPASVGSHGTVMLSASAGDLTAYAAIKLVGNVIRVNPVTGADTNDGSVGAPVKTLARALALAEAGTTIYLAGGTYSEASGESFREASDDEAGYLVPAGVELTADPNEKSTPVVIRNYAADGVGLRFQGDANVSSIQIEGFERGIVAATGKLLLADVTTLAIGTAAVTLEGTAEMSCTDCHISVAQGVAFTLDDHAKLRVDGASSINSMSPDTASNLVAIHLLQGSQAEAVINLAGGVASGTHAVLGGKLTVQDVDVRLRSDTPEQILVGAEGQLAMFGGRVSGGYFVDGSDFAAALWSSGTLSINGTTFEENQAGSLWIHGGSAEIHNATFRNIGDPDTVFAGYGLNAIVVDDGAKLLMRGTRIRNVTEAGNYDPPTPGTHGVGIYISDVSGGIDLGTASEPGRNFFSDCGFTCLMIATGAGERTVLAAGNTWIAEEQGADASGRYAPQLVDGGSWGRNFRVGAPSKIQF